MKRHWTKSVDQALKEAQVAVRVLTLLKANPTKTYKTLALELGYSPSSAGSHLSTLIRGYGVVRGSGTGQTKEQIAARAVKIHETCLKRKAAAA